MKNAIILTAITMIFVGCDNEPMNLKTGDVYEIRYENKVILVTDSKFVYIDKRTGATLSEINRK